MRKSTKEFDTLANLAERDNEQLGAKKGLKVDMPQGKTLLHSPPACETERPEEFSAPRNNNNGKLTKM